MGVKLNGKQLQPPTTWAAAGFRSTSLQRAGQRRRTLSLAVGGRGQTGMRMRRQKPVSSAERTLLPTSRSVSSPSPR